MNLSKKHKSIEYYLRIIWYVIEIIEYHMLLLFGKIIYWNRCIYVISERGTDARDNGFHMFRYMRLKHPELEVYYIIDRCSPDRKKIKQYGNIIDYKSFKNKILYISAKFKISTHIGGGSPYLFSSSRLKNLVYWHGKLIFLQHGVTKDNLPQLYSENTKLDLFICGGKPEHEYVLKNFHYSNNEVKYTGLARYDSLHNLKMKNQILVMPTWRIYLKGIKQSEFLKSDYFIKWNSFINNTNLIKELDGREINLVFYPHYEIQPYIKCFSSKSKSVTIADFEHYDVQQLLKESKLLITDFSSVFFDFAYMRKPCIYYQFNRETFYESHYAKGYFDYDTLGFGEIAMNEKDLEKITLDYIRSQFSLKELYKERMISFFPLYDRHNCERIFEEIKRIS